MQLFKLFPISLSSLFITLAMLFFLLHRLIFLYPSVIDSGVSYLMYPVLLTQKIIVDPIATFARKRKSFDELTQLYDTVTAEKEKLQAQVIALQAQIDFISATQELILYQQRYEFSHQTLSQIIFKQLNAQEQFYLVDSGSAQGIKEGMVAVYKNCLLGRVTQVFPYYSKITLITDKRSNVAAYCSKTISHGIVEGINSTQDFELKFVSHLEKMQNDDLVLSSGQGLVFPHGFALGKITEFFVDGLYYRVKLKPLVDLQEVQYCYVVQKGA